MLLPVSYTHLDVYKRQDYAFVVKNPGIKYTVPFVRYFVEHKVKILTEVEIGYRYATKFKYGAVTGTNGKTTITTMLYEMLKYNHKAIVAGNIGWPLSELQLLGIEHFAPHVSVVCNLAPDHLDYMPSVESVSYTHLDVYKRQSP